MTNFRTTIEAILFPLLVMACGSAHATLVTIDSNNYAAGTDISNAISGVSLSLWSYDQSTPLNPATYAPIFVADCGSHCAGGRYDGTKMIARSGSGGSFSNPQGSTRYPTWDHTTPPPSSFSVLRADFLNPTNYVQIISATHGMSGDPPQLAAFDAGGALLGVCNVGTTYSPTNSFCDVQSLSLGEWDEFRSVFRLSINTGSNNIAFIAAGGSSASAEVFSLAFSDVPEPSSMSLMILGIVICALMSGRNRRLQA
jgi:hypothetical protein